MGRHFFSLGQSVTEDSWRGLECWQAFRLTLSCPKRQQEFPDCCFQHAEGPMKTETFVLDEQILQKITLRWL